VRDERGSGERDDRVSALPDGDHANNDENQCELELKEREHKGCCDPSLAIDSRGDIESYEEGYNTRDAGKSASQVD